MIDLEKEREAFENVYWVTGAHYEKQGGYYSTPQDPDDVGFEVEYKWDAWQQRAELAQQEMEATNRELEFATKTINNLLEKLAKYESNDVVVLPRIPGDEMVEAMGYAVCNMGGDCWLDTDEAYKAMIEAGEIK